jgi:predicted N-acetyltransferase YhbS
MVSIEAEAPGDGAAIEQLLDKAFGPGRLAKSAYRLREGVEPLASLSYVARENGGVIGSLRFWPIAVGRRARALLLGPLVVEPALRGRGVGIGLMLRGLARARAEGHRVVFLVGDEPYYARVGFRRVEPSRFVFPGPVDEKRLLVRELAPHSLAGVGGVIERFRGAALAALAPPSEHDEEADKRKRGQRLEQRAL